MRKCVGIYGKDEEQKLVRGFKNSPTLEEFPGGSRDKFMFVICSREMPGGRENARERRGRNGERSGCQESLIT